MNTKIEIKQISDREFWIGESRYYLNEDNTLHIIAVGEIDDILLIEYEKATLFFMNKVEGKINLLIDLNKTGKQSNKARLTWKKISDSEKTGKVALFGMNPVSRVLASFVIGISKKRNMLFFKTKEDALKWIKE